MNTSFLNDRFTIGLITGLIGAIPITVFNLSMNYYFQTLRYLDFAAIFIYGHTSKTVFETLFAFAIAYLFLAFLGAIFAYIITGLTSKNLLIKGWVYGVFIWFSTYALTLLFRVPQLLDISLTSAISNFIGASIWGLSMAYSLLWLNKKVNI